MKKRVLSLILILPFIVMFLVFGFSRTVNLFVDLAAEGLSWDYDDHEAMEYSSAAWEQGIELIAKVYPFGAAQSSDDIVWSIIDENRFNGEGLLEGEHVAVIEKREDGKTYLRKFYDGIVTIAATVPGTTLYDSFTAYLFTSDVPPESGPQAVIITGSDYSVSSIKSSYRDPDDPNNSSKSMVYHDFGKYNIEYIIEDGEIKDEQKVGATEEFTVRVLPSFIPVEKINAEVYGLSNVTVSPTVNNACTVTIGLDSAESDALYSLVATADGWDVTNHADFIVRDGVNVRSYEDLMYCTNPDHPEIICLRTSLESASNVANNPKLGLFGRRDEKNKNKNNIVYKNKNNIVYKNKNKNNIVCDYTKIQSTYDVDYYKHKSEYKDSDTELNVGVTFYKNVYGNGYTLNAHELTYPSEEQERNGVTTAFLGANDKFRGPLTFVYANTARCFGQDNISFLIMEDDITVDNITLKSCNNVDNLSNLDYVGTTVEVMGKNVTIKNSQLMNGRTVLRTMSNKNLTVDACMLSYAREFILKVGSNEFVHAASGLADTLQTFERLSPAVLPDGTNIADNIDSTVTVRNSYFHTSGIFCVGMDTHFAGTYLYSFPNWGIHDMAATSYPSELTLEGDVKFYDWKTVSGLDSTTLIDIEADSDYKDLFNISDIISKYDEMNDTENLLYKRDGELYVHGGVAFFGGGRNLSRVSFENLNPDAKQYFINYEDIGYGRVYEADGYTPLKDGGFAISLNDSLNAAYGRPKHGIGATNASILWHAAGEGDFKFYIYDASEDAAAISLIGKIPTVNMLAKYANYD